MAHGRLRRVLGAVLGLAPGDIEFGTGPHGKPELAGHAGAAGVHFNLSHSGSVGLIGWCWQRAIGVDVEIWRATRDQAALVRRYFAPGEIAAWEALPPERRQEAFFNLWTRKEAYLKALGLGLTLALDSFDVSHEAGSGARVLRPAADAAQGGVWSLAAPEVGHGLSAAIVLQAAVVSVTASG